MSSALNCHIYYQDISDTMVKDEIRKMWESVDRRIVVIINIFELNIDRLDIYVVVYIRSIYQMQNYN